MRLRPKTKIARRLRRNSTDAESRLWQALRRVDVGGKLLRQHPVGDHVVDFALPAAKLAIEVDGGRHALDAEADARRSVEIARHGYRVLRFWNNEVLENLDGVLEAIRREARKSPHLTPTLSAPRGRRGR